VAFPDEILSRIVPKFHLKTGKWANGGMEFMRRNLYGSFRRIGILRNKILKDRGGIRAAFSNRILSFIGGAFCRGRILR